jgi:hypothetical protein
LSRQRTTCVAKEDVNFSSIDNNEIIAINLGHHMSSITIRILDDNLKASLRMRAARHGVSMEQEMRNILLDSGKFDACDPQHQRL